MGFRGSNASGGRIVLLPGAFWAHDASKMATLGASSTLHCNLHNFTVFQSLGGHASASRVSHEPCFCQAHCFVQGPLRFLIVPPNNPTCARSHIWGLPIWGGGKTYGGRKTYQRTRSPENFWTVQRMSVTTLYQRPPKGAGKRVPHENCQKMSKMFLTLFDDF